MSADTDPGVEGDRGGGKARARRVVRGRLHTPDMLLTALRDPTNGLTEWDRCRLLRRLPADHVAVAARDASPALRAEAARLIADAAILRALSGDSGAGVRRGQQRCPSTEMAALGGWRPFRLAVVPRRPYVAGSPLASPRVAVETRGSVRRHLSGARDLGCSRAPRLPDSGPLHVSHRVPVADGEGVVVGGDDPVAGYAAEGAVRGSRGPAVRHTVRVSDAVRRRSRLPGKHRRRPPRP
jgi:hypothetical protein